MSDGKPNFRIPGGVIAWLIPLLGFAVAWGVVTQKQCDQEERVSGLEETVKSSTKDIEVIKNDVRWIKSFLEKNK